MTIPVKFARAITGSTIPFPERVTGGSAGFDLRAAEAKTIDPGQYALVRTGWKMQLPAGYEGQVRPRSGLALRLGITVLNSPGTIDSDYINEIGVILINHSAVPFECVIGDRIAQLVICALPETWAIEVDMLNGPDRGGGFGSSGIK